MASCSRRLRLQPQQPISASAEDVSLGRGESGRGHSCILHQWSSAVLWNRVGFFAFLTQLRRHRVGASSRARQSRCKGTRSCSRCRQSRTVRCTPFAPSRVRRSTQGLESHRPRCATSSTSSNLPSGTGARGDRTCSASSHCRLQSSNSLASRLHNRFPNRV